MPVIGTVQVIVTINYSAIFFIPKADRIVWFRLAEVGKLALGNLVLAVVIDYRVRDSLPISICAARDINISFATKSS